MNTEFEATFAPIDKKELRQKLIDSGALCIKKEFFQKRVNFNLPKESPYYKTGWMRVRDEGGVIRMSMKAILNNDSMEGQKEIDLCVDDFEKAREMLNNLGLYEKSYQETKREIWNKDGIEICIDEWPWLEPFVEIEGKTEEKVREIANSLGFQWEDAIFGAVDVQYAKKYNIEKSVVNNQTPKLVFQGECPF